MKSFTVVYLDQAEESLIEMWLSSCNRSEVTEAVDAADRQLADDPFEYSGYLEDDDLWFFETGPLRFYFDVRFDDRIIEVALVVWKSSWNGEGRR